MLKLMREHTKAIMIIVIAFFVASCFAGYGLYVRGGGADGQRDYPVAEVDGHEIMRSTLERAAMQIAEQTGSNITSADLPGLRKAALDVLVLQNEVMKEIKDRKIKVEDADIDAAYKNMMDNFPTREEFMNYVKRSGLTEKQIKDNIAEQLKVQKLMASLGDDVKIDDKEAREFYEGTKNYLFKEPSGVMINITTFTDKEAAEAARKALEAGEKWDAVMEKEKSKIDMSTPWDKPILMTDQLMRTQIEFAPIKPYPFDKVTPVKDAGEGRYYIAIKRSKVESRIVPFEAASADVMNLLKNQQVQKKQQEMYAEMQKRAEVKILDNSIFPEEKPADAEAPAASQDKSE